MLVALSTLFLLHYSLFSISYRGPAKSFVTGFGLLQCYVLSYFYYKPSKYSPFTETHFCNLFTQSRKADSLLLVSVGDTDK